MKYHIPVDRKIWDAATSAFVSTAFTVVLDTDKIKADAFIRAATNKSKKSKALCGALVIQMEGK